MHAFRSYIFAALIACDSGPTCTSKTRQILSVQYSLLRNS